MILKMSHEKSEPTAEEMEFIKSELDLLVREYRLEDFGDSLAASVYLLDGMLSMGLIEKSREGIEKGMDIIVKRFPKIDDSFRRFASAVLDKTISEMKQMARPN